MLLFHSICALFSFWEFGMALLLPAALGAAFFGMAAEMVLLAVIIGLGLGLLVSLLMKKKAA